MHWTSEASDDNDDGAEESTDPVKWLEREVSRTADRTAPLHRQLARARRRHVRARAHDEREGWAETKEEDPPAPGVHVSAKMGRRACERKEG